MNPVGYGVMKDDKPYGIWPISFVHASGVARRVKGEVVPVFIGTAVPPAEAPTKSEDLA